ncbi:MAG: P1 family peptidase [Anaerolineaceae bacterium]|nr:P1 family peptidase [Anaerolineaceae bacterium]
MNIQNSITDVGNLLVGHAQNLEALTGCTVILSPQGATAGVSQRGGAPGTRETDLLRPMHMIEKVHAIVLAGGSAYGLDAAGGVMRWLENKKIGFNTGSTLVPIVPAAIIYDLGIGNPKIRPDAEMGYEACENAKKTKPEEGNFGAGTGASVGKIFGMSHAMKSGIGTSSRQIGGGAILGAIAVVNAFGDIVDSQSRKIIAGVRNIKKSKADSSFQDSFADTLKVMNSLIGRGILSIAGKQNTVIGVMATNVKLTKEEANKFAESASDGITLAVQPAFTMLDGDTVFALSTGNRKLDLNILCAFAPLVFADAIRNAVLAAKPAAGLPSAKNK